MQTLPEIAELKEGGVILINKPYRWTSFDAINRIKKVTGAKTGHCGTLDPLATGLLICCTGKFTKKITDYQQLPKEYTGIIHLGATTPTYDLESEPQDPKPFEHLTEEDIKAATLPFTGNILQTPPIHSAIKKDGKRAYELARKGEEIVLQPRPVKLPEVHFRVSCSTGTYIRSLANDLGAALGCGGYLQELCRTKIGEFDVANALTPQQWKEYWFPPVEGEEQTA
jgi:tRNA pseudouridine55 synthase